MKIQYISEYALPPQIGRKPFFADKRCGEFQPERIFRAIFNTEGGVFSLKIMIPLGE